MRERKEHVCNVCITFFPFQWILENIIFFRLNSFEKEIDSVIKILREFQLADVLIVKALVP